MPSTAPRRLPQTLVHWYLVEHPRHALSTYRMLAEVLWERSSFIFLLKTLFAPWKQISDPYPGQGFNIQAILETWTLNITARAIGMIFRLTAIIYGLAIQLLLIVGILSYLSVWFLFPLLCVIGYPFFILLIP